MSFVAGLSTTVATILLCVLLFAEEAGVPLPFAPGEATLIAAGLLIASGGLAWWIFIPLAWIACGAGAMLAYLWARALGARGLESLAERLHATATLHRVEERLRAAGPAGIAVSRLIPGLRIYTTLAAGAIRIPEREFVTGAMPAMAVWVVVFTVLGAAVGLPVEHFFNSIQKEAVRGAVLLVAGIGAYVALRRIPAGNDDHALLDTPGAGRILVALAIDMGVVASVLIGLDLFARFFLGIDESRASWSELVAVAAVIAVFYITVSRRGRGATAGESVFHLTYRRRGLRRERRPPDLTGTASR